MYSDNLRVPGYRRNGSVAIGNNNSAKNLKFSKFKP